MLMLWEGDDWRLSVQVEVFKFRQLKLYKESSTQLSPLSRQERGKYQRRTCW